jgi:alkyl hydroperoxide reductase subunit AhpC
MLKFYKVDVSFSCDANHIALQIKLSDYIGHKYVVLFFYPLDFTFVCPTGDIIIYPFTFLVYGCDDI